MSGEPISLDEAVSLGTVHLQQVLSAAGVRSLALKGPAFVALGVRRPRRSNDVDLLVHPDDRTTATETLAEAGWSIISHWFPPALDDVIYSTTFRHSHFPATLDLHHRFSGLLAEPGPVFEALWAKGATVDIAHRPVTTVGSEHALVIEALNRFKVMDGGRRAGAAAVVAQAEPVDDVRAVEEAAEEVGARHTAAPLVSALGGAEPASEPPAGYERWVTRGARNSGRDLIADLVLRAPRHIPRVVWQQLTLDPAIARFWAHAHRVPYRSRWQILGLRIRRMFRV